MSCIDQYVGDRTCQIVPSPPGQWLPSVMRTPVALPPPPGMEQRHAATQFRENAPLNQRLTEQAERLRKEARGTSPGVKRDQLIRQARQAETASQYLQRGRPVYIEGRLRVEEYTDRDGNKRHSLEVNATDMQFISAGARGEDAGAPAAKGAAAPSQAGPEPPTDLTDDDVPF